MTACGLGTPTWAVASGSSEVNLTPKSGTNTADVISSGTAWSAKPLDVGVTVTMNGQTSTPYQITTHTPATMSFDSWTTNCNSTYGFLDVIRYFVYDQLGNNLNIGAFDYNEQFTSPWYDVNSNWGAPMTGPVPTLKSSITCVGPQLAATPAPSPTPVCDFSNSAETLFNNNQVWSIGSLVTGKGIPRQTEELEYFADQALYTNVKPL